MKEEDSWVGIPELNIIFLNFCVCLVVLSQCVIINCKDKAINKIIVSNFPHEEIHLQMNKWIL